MPVGGIKEKIIASMVNGIKTIYMPKDNYDDVLEYYELYQNKLDIKFVDNYKEVYRDFVEKYQK